MLKLYTLNKNVITDVTDKEIIDYVMANPSIANAIAYAVDNNELNKWLKDVAAEFGNLCDITTDEAIEILEDSEAESLWHNGMRNIAEAASELRIICGV
jgi:hypothetical protein